MHQALDNTRRHAYSHHIQRLMLTNNSALLAGVAPAEIEQWYLAIYPDDLSGWKCQTPLAWRYVR